MVEPENVLLLNLSEIPEGHGWVISGISKGFPTVLFAASDSYHIPGECEDELPDGDRQLLAIRFRDTKQLKALKVAVDALMESPKGGM